MSSLLKNLHVHFDDDILSGQMAQKKLDDDLAAQKAATILYYSREKLLEFGKSKASKEPPKMFHLSGADDKRKEKIRLVLKNSDILKAWTQKNGVAAGGDSITSKGGVAENNAYTDQARSNFQQMISAAVSNAQLHNMEYATATATTRRRIGSGRIIDNNSARDNYFPIGMDTRYMRNKLFKEDGKTVKNYKSSFDLNWNNTETVNQSAENDNTDAKSDEHEPEWANCGPISKHDIIELHGFDGPEDEDTQKSESTSISPPARSTPSKNGSKKAAKMDDHFNFEDFLKLDLPASVNCSSRDLGAGESRFSQWFGRDKLTQSNKFNNGNGQQTAQQFFDYHQKVNQKKMNGGSNITSGGPNKLRSVNELEADLCPTSAKTKEAKEQQMNVDAIRMMLSQLAASSVQKQRSTMNSAQSNYLLSLINKSAESLYQYRLSQNAIMKRPDAQLLLHRLVSGEITQFHILQQINNPALHQRDRETLLAVFAFCNENQQWLIQQQEQQLKHKEQMSQQFRQLQMMHMKNTTGSFNQPTHQELQYHTQTIMQNAMYKKQFEDQIRNLHGMKPAAPQSKFQPYKSNNYMPNQQYHRSNKQRQYGTGQNGLQFIQSQNKSMWNRQNQTNLPSSFMGTSLNSGLRNSNDILAATMPSFSTKFDASTMPSANDKVSITVEK